jgi:hypothetical protein
MFGDRFFGPRYYGNRYWGEGAATVAFTGTVGDDGTYVVFSREAYLVPVRDEEDGS